MRNTVDFGQSEPAANLLRALWTVMCSCARLLCIFTLIATPAAAQSTTEDGIRAMLRGDYRAALRILRPLADNPTKPDPTAQFFLAVLDDTGHGSDNTRACGLFLRAAQRPNPFSGQSAALAAVIRDQLGDGASMFCVAEESWRGGPPQTFVLGPGHQIVFADTSVRVTYNEQEQGTMLLLPPEVVFLPIQYTPLTVTLPTPGRRHFFQWFVWKPDTPVRPSSWTLWWTLSEVVGDGWILVTNEVLSVVNGAARPASDDVSNLVRLQVNARGEAEFTIVGGPSPRTEPIPSKGSR
jgi:hypothetical protein